MRARRKGESGGALAWWVRSGGERAVGGAGCREWVRYGNGGCCGERAGAVIALCSHCRVLSLLQAVGGASLLLSDAGAGGWFTPG